MKRRDFIIRSSLVSLGSVSLGLQANLPKRGILTAADLQDYLRSLHQVSEPSVDRIVIGDPQTKIARAGTCWQPYFSTLREAREQGINLMIVHEPTFYTHWDLDEEDELFSRTPSPAQEKYLEAVETKKKWIEKNEMGMRLLNEHLSQNIPEIEFIHLNQGCSYRWIPGA